VQLLAVATLLRVITELLFPVLLPAGRGTGGILLLPAIAILAVGYSMPERVGIIAIAGCWLGIYPFVPAWGAPML
jgi:hypothetical protein